MDLAELDAQLNDLEHRLERLRSLYEQYFLGIEKIEPGVARKDFDRRIWELRRQKIHNTAKRFKLQTIIQRYNTFQQYWQRICREIENGTYKRHMLRAERSLTSVGDTQQPKREAEQTASRTRDVRRTAEDDLESLLGSDDLVAEAMAAMDAALGAISEHPKARSSRPAPTGSAEATHRIAPPPLPNRQTPNRPPPQRSAPSQQPAEPARGAPAPEQRRIQPPPLPRKAAPSTPSAARPAPTEKPAALERPAARPAPPKKEPAAAAPRAAGERASLSDQRIEELHHKLVAAKRQNKEAGSVSMQGLAKSLRATEQKLRKQYANRSVDFDVVIKNGKAVVKPVLR